MEAQTVSENVPAVTMMQISLSTRWPVNNEMLFAQSVREVLKMSA